MTKNLKISLIISILFLGLTRTIPIWERNLGRLFNLLLYLFIAILLVWIIIRVIKEIIQLFKNRKKLNFKLFIPILILTISLLVGLFNPLNINLEKVYGQILFRACFEGTQNQATFYLREKDRFEIHWTGVFFYDEYFRGTYKRNGDTLFLKYNKKRPIRFGDKILIDNKREILTTIRQSSDSPNNYVPFYFGYCKGLN